MAQTVRTERQELIDRKKLMGYGFSSEETEKLMASPHAQTAFDADVWVLDWLLEQPDYEAIVDSL